MPQTSICKGRLDLQSAAEGGMSMGVYISMDMPKCCDTCFWCGVFYGEQGDNYYYCGALWQKFKSKKYCIKHPRKGRLGNCPLIPVPDHGRLVDADALETAMFNDPYQDFVHILEQLPTIVPADKEGDT